MSQMKGRLEYSKENECIQKGYSDLRFVHLRNGGMYSTEIRPNNLLSVFWHYYPIFLILMYFVDVPLLGYSLYVERHNVDNFLESAHYLVMIWSLSVGNVDFLYYRKDLDILLRFAGAEFYQYDEDEPQLYKDMKSANVKEIKKISTIGAIIFMSMAVVLDVVQPYLYYLSTKDAIEVKATNPYLPVQMYFPWDTYTLTGFATAYLIHFVSSGIIILNVIANGFSYVNLMILLRCQLEILNHSVLNIDSRAAERFRKKYGFKPHNRKYPGFEENLQKCFCECLKQNIRHHQCLLRWEITSRKMLRVILLFVFFNASILMASTGYLLLKNLDSKVRTFKFVQLLLLEIFHTFLFCYYGEQIVKQSEDLFQNLYKISWFNYGKKFNTMLSVILTKTVKPIFSLTAIFNTPCNLETFNALMSTAYSYFNLINQMKNDI